MLPISDFKRIEKKKDNFNFIGKVKVKVVVACAIFVFILFGAQLVFANHLAVGGRELSQIEKEANTLEAENTILRAQIAKVSSLTTLAQQAPSLGFQKPSKIITF